MNNMWSDKKYINITINILLFLLAVNFMHYGQLVLPIICLILFIDNKFKFKVNDWKIFIILCLFAISFFAFSYQLGFYCVMGFCLPMAYYIGSNLKNKTEENIKNVIYIVAFGMATHMILNFCLEIYFFPDDLVHIFTKIRHYDLWLYLLLPEKTGDIVYNNAWIKTTCTAMFYLPILSCALYLIRYEKNKISKYIGILLFVISTIYSFALGRRTSVLMFGIVVIIELMIEFFNAKNRKEFYKYFLYLLCPIILVALMYVFNIFNLRTFINNSQLMLKISTFGLNPDRLLILFKTLKYYPQFLWGGQNISNIVGLQVHDIFGDIYDYAGIIPFILFIIYYVVTAISIYKTTKILKKQYLYIIIPLIVCIMIQFMLEPIMTGNSIFLICSILCLSSIQNASKM